MLESGRTKTRDGITIAFRRSIPRPDGLPRVALVHSLALDGSIWDDVVLMLQAEAELLVIDCRGHGASTPAPGPYTVELFADDLADVFRHIGWTQAIIVGCSMGGCIAQAFAARHSAMTRGLVLIDTTAWYGADAPSEWRKRAATAEAEGLQGLAKFQTTRWFGDRFRAERPDRVETAMAVFLRTDLKCYAATCAMLGDADLRACLPSLKIPTAIVVGEEDYATPIAAAQDLQNAVAGASLTILPAARHLTPIERPDAIAAEIRALVARTALPAA